MLEQAIEEERRHRRKMTDSMEKFMLPYMISATILLFVILFLPVGFDKKLLILLGTILVYIFIGMAATLVLTAKYMRMMSIADVAKSLIRNKKEKEIRNSDAKTKIEWFTAKLSKTQNAREKIGAMNELMSVYAGECMEDKVDECFEMIMQFTPKAPIEKVIKFDSVLYYYDYKDDTEKYISAYNENEEILQQCWDMHLLMKFLVFSRYISYLIILGEYQKAFECYNLNLEMHEKAAEIDVAYAMSEESKEFHCLDYAMLYCKLGEKEKSAESFRVALERFENTDKPSLKKHLEKVRKMLDEAGIDYT